MMHVLPCARVREDLAAYHDGELSIDDRVLIRSHLQECVACRLEAGSLEELREALREMASSVPGRATGESGRVTGAVLERIKVERQFSLTMQVRGLFEDMHLVWAGLGASVAMLFCIFASAGVLQAASQERPDSLAGIISTIASAESTDPVRLANSVPEMRAFLDSTEAMHGTGDKDAELMLSAFVTREGRIQNIALLEEQASALQVKPEVVLAMLDAASRTRFERPQSGLPVAVNVMWLVTSTTVKGRPDYDRYLVNPPQWKASPIAGPVAPRKRPTAATPVKVPAAENEGLAAA